MLALYQIVVDFFLHETPSLVGMLKCCLCYLIENAKTVRVMLMGA